MPATFTLARVAALSLTATAIALTGAANAATAPIYGGGGTLSEPAIRTMADCLGQQMFTDPTITGVTYTPAGGSATTVCPSPVGLPYEYLLTAVGSGAGLGALLAETASGLPLDTKGDGPGSVAGGTTPTKANSALDTHNFPSIGYPYPFWDVTDSDAPSDTPSPTNDGNSVFTDYSTLVDGAGLNLVQKRGRLWSVPIAAVPVTIPYNPTGLTFGLDTTGNPTAIGEDHELQLSRDALCLVYTHWDSAGANAAVTVAATLPNGTAVQEVSWNDPAFKGFSNSGVYTGTKIVKLNGGVLPSSTAVGIIPFARFDASGTTYLMTLWLSQNCRGFNTTTSAGTASAGHEAFGAQVPRVDPVYPSWYATAYLKANVLTNADGSGAMEAAVKATQYAMGYVGPTVVEPVAAGTVPTAYMQNKNGYAATNQYVAPSTTSVDLALANVSAPAIAGLTDPSSTTGATQNGTRANTWGSALGKAFFRTTNSGAYPITGLTYILGYRCYDGDSTNNVADAVKQLVSFYTNGGVQPADPFGNPTAADKSLLAAGLVPLDHDTAKTSEPTGNPGGTSINFVTAVYNVVAVDPGTKIRPVLTGEVFPHNPYYTPGYLKGPYECKDYSLDTLSENN